MLSRGARGKGSSRWRELGGSIREGELEVAGREGPSGGGGEEGTMALATLGRESASGDKSKK